VTRVLRFVAGGAYVDVVRPPFTTEQFFAVFRDYNEASFRAAFGRHFTFAEEAPIPGMTRTIFRMERRET